MKYFGYICEECQTGQVKDKKIKNYEIDFYQDKFTVPYAIVGECDKCGAIYYAGEELHRWEQEYKKWQTKSKLYLAPEKITEIRDYLNMKQKDFADFLGVSRQSLSVWEKPDRPSVQPKNVDIILRILHSEISATAQPTIQKMMELYKKGADDLGSIQVDPDQELQMILPKSTWKLLATKAEENNTKPYTELVKIVELAAHKHYAN